MFLGDAENNVKSFNADYVKIWYNVDRHYTGSERSEVAILRGKHVRSTWYNIF